MTVPNWYRMRGGFRPSINARTGVVSVREVWCCTNLDRIGTGYDTSVAAIEGSVPRAPLSAHPDPALASAVCVNRYRVYGPVRGVCKVVVDYSSDLRFGSANRAGTTNYGRVMETRIPVLTKVSVPTDAGPSFQYLEVVNREDMPTVRRTQLTRMHAKVIGGEADAINHQITVGCVGKVYIYKLNPYVPDPTGIPYILVDFKIRALPTGGTWVEYHHESLAPVAAIPANTWPGQDIALPALGWLETYSQPHYGNMTADITAVSPPLALGAPLP